MAIQADIGAGARVFLDLKYHDIPNTVAKAVESAVRLDVQLLTIHTSGGSAMMAAAEKAAQETAKTLGRSAPLVLGVTVLTSMDAATLSSVGVGRSPLDQVVHLATLVRDCGLDGVVASPQETAAIRAARAASPHTLKIEVEVTSLAEVREALAAESRTGRR